MAERERGSVLVLMPAAVLIFIVLGALCVDFSGVWAAQRRLTIAAEAAANDVVTQALDLDALYGDGAVELVPDRAVEVARRSLAAAGLGRLDPSILAVDVDGDTVVVTVTGVAHHLFAGALPGGFDRTTLRVTATATAVSSDA